MTKHLLGLARLALVLALVLAVTLVASPFTAQAATLAPGDDAPAFSVTGVDGEAVDLAALKGKTVVLEWSNHQCPYVVKHYETGNMQATQEAATADADVVWVTVVSSAPGKQGHIDAATAKKLTEDRAAHPTHIVLDEDGALGTAYGALTTPHMFVIDTQGKLAYMGAIDDQPTARGDTVGANNYVLAALESLKNGETPELPQTKPYGCGIKY